MYIFIFWVVFSQAVSKAVFYDLYTQNDFLNFKYTDKLFLISIELIQLIKSWIELKLQYSRFLCMLVDKRFRMIKLFASDPVLHQ